MPKSQLRFLVDHFEGCSPPTPCASCRAMFFLREKLAEDDIKILLEYAAEAGPVARYHVVSSVPIPAVISIDDIEGLSVRGANILKKKKGMTTLDDVRSRLEEIRKIKGFGKRSFAAVKMALAEQK